MLTIVAETRYEDSMASRRADDRKVVLSLPIEVIEWIDREAARKFTSTAQHLRAVIVDLFLEAHELQDAETTSTRSGARHSHATRSGFKGVYPYGKRWATVIHEGGRRQRLGVYDTPEEAARAYDQYLISRSSDPRAAVNFPHELDALRDASAPFVEKLAAGQVNDIEWQQWQQTTRDRAAPSAEPLSVLPASATKVDATTPLIDRPAKSLTRRETLATPLVRPDPVPAEPDDDRGSDRFH